MIIFADAHSGTAMFVIKAATMPPPRAARFLYVGLALLMLAIAIAGFWPSYFGPVLTAGAGALAVIHLHAATFTGWLLLVLLQAWFAATRRLRLHRRIGPWIFGYGVFLLLVGWYTAIRVFADRLQDAGFQAASQALYVPVTDLLFFAPVLLAAWIWRRNGEAHKRLIVVATSALLIAASHRLIGATIGRPPPLLPVLAVWLSPIAAGLLHDLARHRRVHPVYLLGIALVLAMKFRPRLQTTDAWNAFASWLARIVG